MYKIHRTENVTSREFLNHTGRNVNWYLERNTAYTVKLKTAKFVIQKTEFQIS